MFSSSHSAALVSTAPADGPVPASSATRFRTCECTTPSREPGSCCGRAQPSYDASVVSPSPTARTAANAIGRSTARTSAANACIGVKRRHERTVANTNSASSAAGCDASATAALQGTVRHQMRAHDEGEDVKQRRMYRGAKERERSWARSKGAKKFGILHAQL